MATSPVDTARAAVDLTFEELYRGFRADVYRAALRKLGNAQDAEDVTQAAFADAYRAVLRGARPQSPRAWLLAISENVRRRRFRTAQRRPREEALDDADFPLAAELPYEQSRALSEALATLPSEQRRIFVLREVVGLSYAEIAEELGSTVGSVQMLLFRARRSLRDLLDPPTVAIRRPVFLPPLPGWIAGAWSRIEIAALTPRAAASLGAAVLTVGGASVAVPVSQADGLRRAPANAPATALPTAATAAKPAAARVVARTAGREASPTAVAVTTVRMKAHSRPVSEPQPVATLPAASASVPVVVATSEPAPAAGTPQAVPALPDVVVTQVPPVPPVPPVTSVVTPPVELPAPPVSVPAPLPLPAPVPLPVTPPPSLPPAVQAATGAAGAAGASAPPLPVPLPPLPVPPPLP